MAKKRKHHKSSRRFLRNPPPMRTMAMNALVALGAGGLGYLAARVGTTYGAHFLPAAVPAKAREPIAGALTGAAVIVAAEMGLSKWPMAKISAAAGSTIPLVESLVNMTPIGMKIGTMKTILIPADSSTAPALPAPGMSASLQAALQASLQDRDEGEVYVSA